MNMSRTTYIRLATFWLWIVTLLLGLLVYFISGRNYSVSPSYTLDCLTKFVTFVLPQLGVMGVFFFQLQHQEQKAIDTREPALTLAAHLSLVYNVIFWISLVFGVGFLWLGEDMGAATDNLLKLMGLLGFFSTTPIAYLYTARYR